MSSRRQHIHQQSGLFGLAVIFVFGLIAPICHADEATTQFLKSYCIHCHGAKTQKADRRFDTLPNKIATLDDLDR